MRPLILSALLGLAAVSAHAANPHVLLKTSSGEIEVEVFLDKAPTSALNFLKYVRDGQYQGTIFHRIIPGFVVQGGGLLPDMSEKPVKSSIVNEAKNGLSNARGTLSMARTMAPHSAGAQFYINLSDNVRLDYREDSPRGWGYAVFGRVVRGMDVVDKMAQAPTGNAGEHQNVPQTPIVLEQAALVPAK